ncbi:MAG: NAD-dependent epimerase/dehydratase family protein [Desulfobulbaceae bacterium]|jgi:nucleoside-diphosphate-sugar epimerase|nr:NAD-dependent epimerase/dehydratase family protein [Desulfobulbaceae bacterium]
MPENLCAMTPATPVLVTGATGFTGQNLVKKLAAAGLNITAVARKSSNLQPLANLPITWLRGEVYDEELIREAAKGQQYIFHIAAAFRDAKSNYQDYWNIHVKSTRLLAQEAANNPNFRRMIQVSTIGVHGHIEQPPADETAPFAPDDDYQKTKLEAELWLKEFAVKRDFDYTVIRPCGIYGPGERRFLKLFKMATGPLFPLLGHGKCLVHLVHVEDLTEAMMLAATAPQAKGQAFIIGANEAIATADIAAIVARHFGVKNRVIRLPITPFFLAGDLCEALCKPLGIEPPIYRRRVAFYAKDRSFTITKMQKILGFQPRYDNERGLIETADWYVEQGWLKAPKRR